MPRPRKSCSLNSSGLSPATEERRTETSGLADGGAGAPRRTGRETSGRRAAANCTELVGRPPVWRTAGPGDPPPTVALASERVGSGKACKPHSFSARDWTWVAGWKRMEASPIVTDPNPAAVVNESFADFAVIPTKET